jgi:V/A-type H+/Na+-transporting ATPase subunit B
MKDGIGKDRTREDHADVASQLYSAYALCNDARSLAAIIGEEGLSSRDQDYLRFGEEFERRLVNQGKHENRPIERTLEIAWNVLSLLPEEELTRVHPEFLKRFMPQPNLGGSVSIVSWEHKLDKNQFDSNKEDA